MRSTRGETTKLHTFRRRYIGKKTELPTRVFFSHPLPSLVIRLRPCIISSTPLPAPAPPLPKQPFFCRLYTSRASSEKAGSGDTLPDEKCISILRKMSKMQQESIDMYRKGNREDLVEKEVNTQQIIDAMLPQVREAQGGTFISCF